MAQGNIRKSEIIYVQGDATLPTGDGKKVVVHICNDLGKWGKGFVLAISKKWPEPEREYKAAFSGGKSLTLGEVQFVPVDTHITIANIIGQHGIKRKASAKETAPPIRYLAVKQGLEKVAQYTKDNNASVHMPRIGCGLAGGKWPQIEAIIKETLCDTGTLVTVYDYQ